MHVNISIAMTSRSVHHPLSLCKYIRNNLESYSKIYSTLKKTFGNFLGFVLDNYRKQSTLGLLPDKFQKSSKNAP